jgi:HSP20 family protein
MLVRTDPFREFDRLIQQALGTMARPAVMPMDTWRAADELVVAF